MCYSNSDKCNGVDDCGDASDERRCETQGACQSGEVKCEDTVQCIAISDVCNGVVDCMNGLDESDCDTKECPGGRVKCANGTRLVM
jgi:hypothetical protein